METTGIYEWTREMIHFYWLIMMRYCSPKRSHQSIHLLPFVCNDYRHFLNGPDPTSALISPLTMIISSQFHIPCLPLKPWIFSSDMFQFCLHKNLIYNFLNGVIWIKMTMLSIYQKEKIDCTCLKFKIYH